MCTYLSLTIPSCIDLSELEVQLDPETGEFDYNSVPVSVIAGLNKLDPSQYDLDDPQTVAIVILNWYKLERQRGYPRQRMIELLIYSTLGQSALKQALDETIH